MQRNKFAEALLLLLPVLFIVGLGWRWHDKGPSRVVVTGVDFVKNGKKASTPDMETVLVTIHVGYTVNRPQWWGQYLNEATTDYGLHNKQGHQYPCGLVGISSDKYNPVTQRYDLVMDVLEVPNALGVQAQAIYKYQSNLSLTIPPFPMVKVVKIDAPLKFGISQP